MRELKKCRTCRAEVELSNYPLDPESKSADGRLDICNLCSLLSSDYFRIERQDESAEKVTDKTFNPKEPFFTINSNQRIVIDSHGPQPAKSAIPEVLARPERRLKKATATMGEIVIPAVKYQPAVPAREYIKGTPRIIIDEKTMIVAKELLNDKSSDI